MDCLEVPLNSSSPPVLEGSVRKTLAKRSKKQKSKDSNITLALSSDPSSEVRVQSTNDDSIVSKRSSSRLGYFDDEFLRHFVSKPARRSPLINRGYYIRCSAVRRRIADFLSEDKGVKKQIVSLGCGFDTGFYIWSSKDLFESSSHCYYEIDFDEVVKRKSAMIRQTPELKEWIKGEYGDPKHYEIQGQNYKLFDVDLRNIETVSNKLITIGKIDVDLPTLFLAECVLTYIDAEDTSRLIKWISSTFSRGQFLTYEQILPDDAFGDVMCSNLKSRGSPLLGISHFPNATAQRQRYERLGFEQVSSMDINEYWENLDLIERKRIEDLEPFDEEEEWKIKCAHYVVVLARKNALESSGTFVKALGTLGTALESALKRVQSKLIEIESGSLYKEAEWSSSLSSLVTGKSSRWGHSASVFNLNTIIVFGGYGGSASHSRLNDIALFNTDSLEWSEPLVSGIIPSTRMFHTMTYNEEVKAYVLFGGREGPEKPLNDLFLLDVFRWSRVNNSELEAKNGIENIQKPSPRWRHTAVSLGRFIYVFGGRSKEGIMGDLWELDVTTFTWRNIIPVGEGLPKRRYGHSMVAFEGKIFIFGGLETTDSLMNDVWSYDPVKNTWDLLECRGTPPFPRFSHATCTIDHVMFIIGGVTNRREAGTPTPNDVYCLDLRTSTWEHVGTAGSIPTRSLLCKHTISAIDNKIFVIGGGALCFSFGSHFSHMEVLLLQGRVDEITRKMSSTEPVALQVQDSSNKIQSKSEKKSKGPRKLAQSSFKIKKYDNPTKDQFLNEIYSARLPAILTNVDIGTCTKSWLSAEHIKTRVAGKQVSVHVAKNRYMDFLNRNFVFKTMPFEELVDQVVSTSKQSLEDSERLYLRSIGENPRKEVSDVFKSFPELVKEDFKVPDCVPLAHPDHPKYFSSALRFSSNDIRMWTHFDVMDNILCEIKGKKRVVMWAPEEIGNLYVKESTSHVLDVDNPDLQKFPKFAKAKRIEFTLNEGEILFIPAFWFHNLLTLEPCIAINTFWKHLEDSYYEKKDLYGNRDLLFGTKAIEEAEIVSQTLAKMPEEYRNFYARKIIAQLEAKFNL